MKKISLLVLICMLLSVVFMACNKNVAVCPDPSAHESNTDATDATDGKDEPGTTEHTHSYAEAWSFDATNHYHACECGAKNESAAHADANNDGECDVCKVIMSNTHVFDTAWTSDATDHWHAALCGHDLVDAKEAHKADALGFCSVCGYKVSTPDVSTISKALAVAALAQSKVVNGTLYFDGAYISEETNYVYGDGTFQSTTINPDGSITIYAYLNEDGSVCYVKFDTIDTMNPVTIIPDADAECMAGPAVDLTNPLSQSISVYGAYQLVDFFLNVYPEALAIEGLEIVETVKDGVYSYTYTFEEEVQYMGTYTNTITATFTIDPDNYYIDNLSVVVSKSGDYSNETYAYTYEQRIEDKVYTPDTLVPTELAFKNNEGEVITFTDGKANTINANIGTYNVAIEVVAPTTAFLEAFGQIVPVVLDDEGNEMSGAYVYYDVELKAIVANFFAAGTYNISLTLGDNTYVIPFNVVWNDPETIGIGKEGDWDVEQITSAEVFTGIELPLVSVVESGCNPAVVATVTDGATITETVIDGTTYYVFKAETAGEYTVKFVSVVNEEVFAEAVITVSAPPSVEDVASGSYTSSDPEWYPMDLVFDTEAGTITIESGVFSYDTWDYEYITETFTYTITDGVFAVVADDGNTGIITDIKIENFVLYVYSNEAMDYVAMVAVSDGDDSGDTGATGTVIEAGTQFEPAWIEAGVTATYTTTIAAGEYGYFTMDAMTSVYTVEFTSEDGTQAWFQTKAEMPFYVVDVDPVQMSWFDFYIKNTTDAEITVTFTLTFS